MFAYADNALQPSKSESQTLHAAYVWKGLPAFVTWKSRPAKDGELLFCMGKANHITCSQPLYTRVPFISPRQRKNAECEKYEPFHQYLWRSYVTWGVHFPPSSTALLLPFSVRTQNAGRIRGRLFILAHFPAPKANMNEWWMTSFFPCC
jgi:hypothetical protein